MYLSMERETKEERETLYSVCYSKNYNNIYNIKRNWKRREKSYSICVSKNLNDVLYKKKERRETSHSVCVSKNHKNI